MLMSLFCNTAELAGCTLSDLTLMCAIGVPTLFLIMWMLGD
jgi:hypothetical protein